MLLSSLVAPRHRGRHVPSLGQIFNFGPGFRRGLIALAVGWSLLLPVPATAASASRVEVENTPATIKRRTFDPANPPADMPPLGMNEAALCAYGFTCQVAIKAAALPSGWKLRPARVTELKFTTHLEITVWLPIGADAKLRAHEEAHREICEVIYRDAAAVAHRLGQEVIGGLLPNAPRDEGSMQRELKKIQSQLMADYLRDTATRCTRLQKYFDEITAHGTNTLLERHAIDQTLAQDPGFRRPTVPR